jgi:hypothetical protein
MASFAAARTASAADKKPRDEQFDALLKILPLVPAKGYSSEGKPFPWYTFSLRTERSKIRRFSPKLSNEAGFKTPDLH